jgi:hypothetical protein
MINKMLCFVISFSRDILTLHDLFCCHVCATHSATFVCFFTSPSNDFVSKLFTLCYWLCFPAVGMKIITLAFQRLGGEGGAYGILMVLFAFRCDAKLGVSCFH